MCIRDSLVTVGASEGIDLALRALLNPGEEVLVPEPSYVSYRPCVVMAGGVPVPVNTKAENEFRVTPEELEELITPKTKAPVSYTHLDVYKRQSLYHVIVKFR